MPKRNPKPNKPQPLSKAQIIAAAQTQLESILDTLRPLAADDAWAQAYIIVALEDLIDNRNNPYAPSLAVWLACLDED